MILEKRASRKGGTVELDREGKGYTDQDPTRRRRHGSRGLPLNWRGQGRLKCGPATEDAGDVICKEDTLLTKHSWMKLFSG